MITGASGLLGHALCRRFRADWDVTGVHHAHPVAVAGILAVRADLQDDLTVRKVIRELKPDVIVHAAGLTNVDLCETDPGLARSLNVDLTQRVAECAQELGSKFLHISTDHLFDGRAPFTTEEARLSPINVYAQTKAEAEEIALCSPGALVVRTNFFGNGPEWRPSFSDWLRTRLRSGAETPLFGDVFITPIALDPLAGLLDDLIARDAAGIFNVAGADRVSKHELGVKIAEAFDLDAGLIKETSVDSLALKAPRPKDMSLSVAKLSRFLGAQPPGIDLSIDSMKAC